MQKEDESTNLNHYLERPLARQRCHLLLGNTAIAGHAICKYKPRVLSGVAPDLHKH
jgi:hypothetical protein